MSPTAILAGLGARGVPSEATLPLEILPAGAFEPLYRSPLDVAGGELPLLPLSVYGALAASRPGGAPPSEASASEFFVFLYSRQQAGLGGLAFEEATAAAAAFLFAGAAAAAAAAVGALRAVTREAPEAREPPQRPLGPAAAAAAVSSPVPDRDWCLLPPPPPPPPPPPATAEEEKPPLPPLTSSMARLLRPEGRGTRKVVSCSMMNVFFQRERERERAVLG